MLIMMMSLIQCDGRRFIHGSVLADSVRGLQVVAGASRGQLRAVEGSSEQYRAKGVSRGQ